MKNLLLILLLILTFNATAIAGGRVSVGFWNVENFFDTVPSPFTDDKDYTPLGANRWNTERYEHKTTNLARVLDEMSLDIVGLAEVENSTVVEDLVRALKTDYAYIHLSTSDRRGMDQALLYKGDKFFPDPSPGATRLVRSRSGREFLYVRGKLIGHRVDIVVCHLPSNLNSYDSRLRALRSLYDFADSLQRADPGACPIVMGDFNAAPSEREMREAMHTGRHTMDGAAFLYCPFVELEKRGLGSYVYDGRWRFFDNIFLSSAFLGGGGLRYESCGVLIREWMVSDGRFMPEGWPLRTFSRGRYIGGFSDHLPVLVNLRYG